MILGALMLMALPSMGGSWGDFPLMVDRRLQAKRNPVLRRVYLRDLLGDKRQAFNDVIYRWGLDPTKKVRKQTIGGVPNIFYSRDETIFPGGRSDVAFQCSTGLDDLVDTDDGILTFYTVKGPQWQVNWSARREGGKRKPGVGGTLAKYIGLDSSLVTIKEARKFLTMDSTFVSYVYPHGDGVLEPMFVDKQGVVQEANYWHGYSGEMMANGEVLPLPQLPFFKTTDAELRYLWSEVGREIARTASFDAQPLWG